MKKFALGFAVGIVSAAAMVLPFLLKERQDKFEYGRNAGLVDERIELANTLEKEFGRYDGQASYRLLFAVKTTEVVSVETNGVKTVRVIP